MSEEALIVAKVEELMKALDQVKRYRVLSKLLIDFALIMLVSVVLLLSWDLAINFYRMHTGFYCYYSAPVSYTCTASSATGSPFLQFFAGLSPVVISTAGVLIGVYWVDRKLKSVRVEEWKESLKEGFPGAVKLLQDLKWDSVLEDIRASKIGYSIYFVVKVIGYWLFAFILLFFPYVLGISALHQDVNLFIPAFISFVLVLVLSRNDLQKRYGQVVSLDNLMWELRWFGSEFKSAKFEA
ncbi:MAG TPA: hypothetical protein VEJ19_04280 [Nitrososphaerales archaeon]|nr:hypothetical protein [Nitrososphaerales archaeon]